LTFRRRGIENIGCADKGSLFCLSTKLQIHLKRDSVRESAGTMYEAQSDWMFPAHWARIESEA
jgi:hypothetical protein